MTIKFSIAQYNTFHFINIFKQYYIGLGEDNAVNAVTATTAHAKVI